MAEMAPPLSGDIVAKVSGNSETEAELPCSPSSSLSPSSPSSPHESSDLSSASAAQPPRKKQRLLSPDEASVGVGISTMAAAAAAVIAAAGDISNSKLLHTSTAPGSRPAPVPAPVTVSVAVPAPEEAQEASPEAAPESAPESAPETAPASKDVAFGVASGSGCERRYSAEMLLDLAGSTSAEVRRMSEDERALVHYKRRLRNRESAKRSRARRQATITDIQGELGDLRELTNGLVERCVRLVREGERHEREAGRAREEIETLRKEKAFLESMLRGGR